MLFLAVTVIVFVIVQPPSISEKLGSIILLLPAEVFSISVRFFLLALIPEQPFGVTVWEKLTASA